MKINNLRESALVEMATEAKRPTRWWLAYPLSVIVPMMVVAFIVQTLIGMVYQPATGSIGAQLVEAVMFLSAFATLALWVRFKEGRPVSSLGFRGPQPLQRFLVGVALGALLLIVSVLSMIVAGQYQAVAPQPGGLNGWAALLPALLLGVAHWSIQSSTEETISRGYQLQVGALQLPGWLAILLPGVIFSLLHMTEVGLSEPVAIVNILLYALFVSFIALRQGSLWMVCGIHAGWNWFQGNIVGVPVSGNPPPITSVFTFGPTEGASRLMTGGSFGPEGSLVVTIVYAIAAFLAYRYFASGQLSAAKVRPQQTSAR